MDASKEELQVIIDSLPPGHWDNPRIFTFNDEYRLQHTLVATDPSSGEMYYYDTDLGQFEPLGLR